MNSLRSLVTAGLLSLALCVHAATAEEPSILVNGDFSQGMEGWKVVIPKDSGGTAEVVKDGYEGKPALKIQYGEAEVQPWEGRASVDAKFEAGATYILRCYLMSEPDDGNLELVAWGRSAADKSTTLYSERTGAKATQVWEEFTCQFTVTEAKEEMGISIGNLARPNRITWIANVVITKE